MDRCRDRAGQSRCPRRAPARFRDILKTQRGEPGEKSFLFPPCRRSAPHTPSVHRPTKPRNPPAPRVITTSRTPAVCPEAARPPRRGPRQQRQVALAQAQARGDGAPGGRPGPVEFEPTITPARAAAQRTHRQTPGWRHGAARPFAPAVMAGEVRQALADRPVDSRTVPRTRRRRSARPKRWLMWRKRLLGSRSWLMQGRRSRWETARLAARTRYVGTSRPLGALLEHLLPQCRSQSDRKSVIRTTGCQPAGRTRIQSDRWPRRRRKLAVEARCCSRVVTFASNTSTTAQVPCSPAVHSCDRCPDSYRVLS